MTIASTPLAFLMNQTPMELFHHGGPIMWPILLISLVGLTVVVERVIFIFREAASRQPEVIEKMLDRVEARDFEGALALGKQSSDFVARVLVYTLTHRDASIHNAFIRASNNELKRFQQGVPVLDTVITAAPLLGLLGTVTGMMATFGALGASGDVAAGANAIMGGIGEALIATACGLAIAIIGLIPYNILNARSEEAKHQIADVSNALELILKKTEGHLK